MPRAEDYRGYAEACLTLAQTATLPHDRARLLEMAHAWHEMAVKAEDLQNESSDSALPWKPPE